MGNENELMKRKRLLKEQSRQLLQKSNSLTYFQVRTANQSINDSKNSPRPKRLLGNLWIEGEVCFCFSSAAQGKSIFAVQVGQSLASGVPAFSEFELDLKEGRPVLYIDFELTDKQFEGRYSVETNSNYYEHHFIFSPSFYRLTPLQGIDPKDIEDFGGFVTMVISNLERLVKEIKPIAIIVDNITYLSQEMEKAKEAARVIFALKSLCSENKEFGLSALVLGHTPKRDKSKPLTQDDLAGSKMVSNFIDSSFAIGESAKDSRFKFIKQTKVRSAPWEFNAENVPIFYIEKDWNFLKYKFVDYSTEQAHLASKEDAKKEINGEIDNLLAQGMGVNEIARQLNINKARVSRRKKDWEDAEKQRKGELEPDTETLPEEEQPNF